MKPNRDERLEQAITAIDELIVLALKPAANPRCFSRWRGCSCCSNTTRSPRPNSAHFAMRWRKAIYARLCEPSRLLMPVRAAAGTCA